MENFIIGTRGSLLALTQCLQVKEQLEDLGPHRFTLKVIKTQGDENTQAPLWQLDGKDFFTKELDAALLKGEVDMVVHSYKDLGSERPEGIKLAAITQRKYPHDILFFKKETMELLKAGKLTTFKVGTSSPRRMTNITSNLAEYLPVQDPNLLKVETVNLRGNVNTRLQKCKDGEFDGVVLALAGIERLATGLQSKDNEAYDKFGNPVEILEKILDGMSFMILPLSEFPAAASQGALGIETLEDRQDKGVLKNLLDKLNHNQTIEEVKREREVFQSFGGGCHLAVGITFSEKDGHIKRSVCGTVDERQIKELALEENKNISHNVIEQEVFLGLPSKGKSKTIRDEITEKEFLNIDLQECFKPENGNKDILITGPAITKFLKEGNHREAIKDSPLWASGTKTMKDLARMGLLVHGCADSLGEEVLKSLRESHVVQMILDRPSWKVLTNDSSQNILGESIKVYTKNYKSADDKYREKVEGCRHFFWTSFSQYAHFNEQFKLSPEAKHYCGLGKTLIKFKENNIPITPTCSMQELKSLLNLKEIL